MYEQHVFPDGTKIFNRFTNQYVPDSDEVFQAWINEVQPVYTYEVKQEEVTTTMVDETGNEVTVTDLVDVTVPTPVLNEEGIQLTEPVHTLRVVSCCDGGSVGVQQPSAQEQIDALVEIIAGGA